MYFWHMSPPTWRSCWKKYLFFKISTWKGQNDQIITLQCHTLDIRSIDWEFFLPSNIADIELLSIVKDQIHFIFVVGCKTSLLFVENVNFLRFFLPLCWKRSTVIRKRQKSVVVYESDVKNFAFFNKIFRQKVLTFNVQSKNIWIIFYYHLKLFFFGQFWLIDDEEVNFILWKIFHHIFYFCTSFYSENIWVLFWGIISFSFFFQFASTFHLNFSRILRNFNAADIFWFSREGRNIWWRKNIFWS